MTRELVDRMRTCSAAILADTSIRVTDRIPLLYSDAADLLVEASNLLDVPEPLGEPMEILAAPQAASAGPGSWTTLELPTRPVDYGPYHPRPCPVCGRINARLVQRVNRRLMLTCPECSHRWEYAP